MSPKQKKAAVLKVLRTALRLKQGRKHHDLALCRILAVSTDGYFFIARKVLCQAMNHETNYYMHWWPCEEMFDKTYEVDRDATFRAHTARVIALQLTILMVQCGDIEIE